MINSSRRQLRAFTLIEVMIALAVVAISLAALLAKVGNQVGIAQAIQERTYASWIAQNKLAELRLSNVTVEVSETEDEVRFADLEWALQTTISETGVENLFRIDVRVFRIGEENHIREVTGFIGEPGIPGQANNAWVQSSQSAGEEK